jgi:hypothetical protein
MNFEYNNYQLEVTTEDSLLIGTCKELGYEITTPNGYDRLISKFQETVDDYLELKPYIEDLDNLVESNYSDNEVNEKFSERVSDKLNRIHEQYSNLNFSIEDVTRHYSSRL